MDEFLGIVKLFAGNFAPKGWMFCNGQILSIRQYTALFSLLGTQYGGDGINTFALPDLRGRVAVGAGAGQGLTPVNLGESAGTEANVLTQHHVNLDIEMKKFDIKKTGRDGVPSAVTNIGVSEQWTPINNRQPYLGLNYIICVDAGIYPQRD